MLGLQLVLILDVVHEELVFHVVGEVGHLLGKVPIDRVIAPNTAGRTNLIHLTLDPVEGRHSVVSVFKCVLIGDSISKVV